MTHNAHDLSTFLNGFRTCTATHNFLAECTTLDDVRAGTKTPTRWGTYVRICIKTGRVTFERSKTLADMVAFECSIVPELVPLSTKMASVMESPESGRHEALGRYILEMLSNLERVHKDLGTRKRLCALVYNQFPVEEMLAWTPPTV